MQSPASPIILAVAQNGLAERIAVYRSDNLDGIRAFERWDLVVGNPPHFSDILPGELRFHDEG
jgi:tRNA1(Val) A37 N6-methylase TrmN6